MVVFYGFEKACEVLREDADFLKSLVMNGYLRAFRNEDSMKFKVNDIHDMVDWMSLKEIVKTLKISIYDLKKFIKDHYIETFCIKTIDCIDSRDFKLIERTFNNKKFMTSKEVQKFLHISEKRFKKLLSEEKLTPVFKQGKKNKKSKKQQALFKRFDVVLFSLSKEMEPSEVLLVESVVSEEEIDVSEYDDLEGTAVPTINFSESDSNDEVLLDDGVVVSSEDGSFELSQVEAGVILDDVDGDDWDDIDEDIDNISEFNVFSFSSKTPKTQREWGLVINKLKISNTLKKYFEENWYLLKIQNDILKLVKFDMIQNLFN